MPLSYTADKATDFVWLLGPAEDPHVVGLARAIERRGVRAIHTPSRGAFELVYSVGAATRSTVAGEPFHRCRSAWIYRLPPRHRLSQAQQSWSRDDLFVSQMEADAWRDTVSALMAHLESSGRHVINLPRFGIDRTPKLDILSAAHEVGLDVPKTIATSFPDAAQEAILDFGQTVAKPVRGGAHATLMLPGDERLARLHRAPVTLQERVFGADVRVICLDGRVLSSARLTGFSGEHVDFRKDPQFLQGNTVYEPVELDADTQEQLADLMRDLNVRFCGVDLKETREGFRFIELNLAPAYLEQELALGDDITTALADVLCSSGG